MHMDQSNVALDNYETCCSEQQPILHAHDMSA